MAQAYDAFSMAIVFQLLMTNEDFCFDELWEEPPIWSDFYTKCMGYPADPTGSLLSSPTCALKALCAHLPMPHHPLCLRRQIS